MILIIDNYDSFVYNLSRYFGQLGYTRLVKRHDEITIAEIETLSPSHIVLSPGPCTPNEAGICLDIVKHFGETIPILGICLGHQVIGQAYGAKIIRTPEPKHGKSSLIQHQQTGVFSSLVSPLRVGRYHSLMIDHDTLPKSLTITATSSDGTIMAVQHKTQPVVGLQFHPESILTQHGYELLQNFMTLSRSAYPDTV